MSKSNGRPPKLDPLRQKILIQSVRAGLPLTHAAKLAGVHIATIHAWKAKGKEQTSGSYREFYDAIKKAEVELMGQALLAIQKIAKESKQWTAWAWILERRWPEEFGLQRQEIAELKKQLKELEALIRGSDPQLPSAGGSS